MIHHDLPEKDDRRIALRRLIEQLLGPRGYVSYAHAVNRHPSNFHRSLADPNSNSNRLVELTCALWLLAREHGGSPRELLSRPLQTVDPPAGRNPLQSAFEYLLGQDAPDHSAVRVARTRFSIRNACASEKTMAYPHLRLIAIAMQELMIHGYSPVDAMDHCVDLSDADHFTLYRASAVRKLPADMIRYG